MRHIWNNNIDEFNQKSMIDYLITSDKWIIENVKFVPVVSLGTDHRLVVADPTVLKI